MVEEARKRSLKKHRAERSGKESEKEDVEASRALTLTLMQGPFLILAFGWASAALAAALERARARHGRGGR